MKLELLKGKKILIVGFGQEGKASYAFLKQAVPSARLAVVDAKDGPLYLDTQKQYDIAIKSPGVAKHLISIPYTTPTNIFFGNTRGMIIGVTGSKGKSTTASLIYSILMAAGTRAHLVGNIGNPALSELGNETGADDIYVYELSSYQLDDIAYCPHISVITNFFPEHMDYHGGLEAYWEAKKRIVVHAQTTDFLVFNPAYPRLRQLAKQTKAQAVPYVSQLPFNEDSIPLLGQHNKENVRGAATVGKIFRISDSVMERAVKDFHPLPHRLELVGEYRGISFYDDAISTTPESTMCAIQSFTSVGAICLGGQDRGYDFSELSRLIAQKNIPVIVLFPDSGNAIAKALERIGYRPVHLLVTSDMEEGVRFIYEHTPKGSVALLSTASPSYSIWKNFEEKGRLFQKFVKQYSDNV